MSILKFSEHFNSNVNNDKQIKQNFAILFSFKLFRIIKFIFLLLREASMAAIVNPTKCNSSAFLLHTSKTFSNFELFPIFSQTFLELIITTKLKTILLKQSAVLLTSCQKNIAYIIMFEHLKYCAQ